MAFSRSTPTKDEAILDTQFRSGAKSSGALPPFHLIPWDIFAARLANRYRLGMKKYGEGNWQRGLADRDFILDRANHTLQHIHRAIEHIRAGTCRDYDDDDLAAAMWGIICLMAAQSVPPAVQEPTSGD